MVDGKKIRELREREGLTVVEFSNKVHITQAAVSRIENNIKAPSVELLERIADYFGKTLEYFIKDSASDSTA